MTEEKKRIERGSKPPRLRLPFMQRRQDPGVWAYDHRVGLCVTLIVYLLLAIAFVAWKIVVDAPRSESMLLVDLQALEELQRQKEELEREVKMRQMAAEEFDFSDVRNLVSNENAEPDENLRDDRGTDMREVNASAGAAEEAMRSNRELYEAGLREEQEILSRRGERQEQGEASDTKVKGRVTVSFSLVNPVRHSVRLIVPAYRCEKGGEVTVAITVNRNGAVIAASVDRALSADDYCMQETALDAARRSRFNIDTSAPEKQTGTITYLFIPQ